MQAPLKVILYPDPRLKKISQPVTAFDDKLAGIVHQMFALMHESKGVGLAAPQVGLNVRLFVMNHDGEPGHDKVYINPLLSDADGDAEDEEGCLSLPKVNVDVLRSNTIRITAQDLNGKIFEETETGYLSRIWQHEIDHLNGIMLTDRMGPVAKMTYKRILRDLEYKFAAQLTPKKKRLF